MKKRSIRKIKAWKNDKKDKRKIIGGVHQIPSDESLKKITPSRVVYDCNRGIYPSYKMVEVEWFDAQSGFGQAEFIDELIQQCKPIHTFSVGYLLNENKEGVLLGFMLFGKEMVKHNQLIPKGMIKKVRVLRR